MRPLGNVSSGCLWSSSGLFVFCARRDSRAELAHLGRIVEEKDAGAEKVWVKAGKNDDDLIVQLLFKKQASR